MYGYQGGRRVGLTYIHYFFFWLHWVLVVAHGIFRFSMWALHCSVRAPEHAGSVVVAHGLSSCGAWAPECVGSVVVARRLQSVWAL